MGPIHAVLTGDLVASAESSPESVGDAVRALEQAADEVALWAGHDTHFTRFRGDGWQFYLVAPGLSLAAVLLLVAALRARRTGLETRIAVGFGTINPLGRRRKDLADASGEAFTLSGRALDEMPRHRRMTVSGPSVVRGWHEALFDMAAWIGGRWTPEQAEAVGLALDPRDRRTQAEIAEILGVTRQAVQARLSGAGWDSLTRAISAVREHDWSAGPAS
jgi:hypothetical protein